MTEALYTSPNIKPGSNYTLDTYSTVDNHYTYDMPDGTSVGDFTCPYCGSSDGIEEIQV
jgi:hypothetical protein